MVKHLVLLLGDQLSPGMSSLRGLEPGTTRILMCEVHAEATYVRHHKKKIAFVFSAMRHFASDLRNLGWSVDYTRLEDPDNEGTFRGEVQRAVTTCQPDSVIVTEPGEWRLLADMRTWESDFGVPVELRPDDRFLCSRSEFATWAEGRKQLRLEYFYREMRRKTSLLMNGDQPEGGQWNYDHDNRKAAAAGLFTPQPLKIAPDDITQTVLDVVKARFHDHFGDLTPFWFAVTRADAEKVFETFLMQALPNFGEYQDAMLHDEKFLYHSVISHYLHVGLLDPLTVCRAAEAEYKSGRAPLNAVEGFIRQIIGWREYIRGIYWLKMPEYAQSNYLDATRPLPEFYWTAETPMACIRACVTQTKEEAYAHHIQRLMVTGTFALLAGVNPQELHEWYLSVYIDAIEWVEMPNTLGMSQFADGGLLASKPYAASGAYIDRMSDYCKNCAFDVKVKAGPKACPFNYLYWDFLDRHAAKLARNPRMAQMYRTYEKLSETRRQEITSDASRFLSHL